MVIRNFLELSQQPHNNVLGRTEIKIFGLEIRNSSNVGKGKGHPTTGHEDPEVE
jgi:hypothetical protein